MNYSQSVAQTLISKHDVDIAFDLGHKSLREYEIKNGYFRYRMTDIATVEYRAYLKAMMSICLEHLDHLFDSEFVTLQVENQISKLHVYGVSLSVKIEGFERIFNKQYKDDNYSFCYYLILSMMLRTTVAYYWSAHQIKSLELEPITPKEFVASTYQVIPIGSSSGFLDNNIIYWNIDAKNDVAINFYASKLLTLLIKVGDEKSILTLMSNPLFAVQDTVTLAQAIELAIDSENQQLLVKLTTMLQSIEPRHPAVVLANSYLRKFELYTKSSFSIEEISKMSGIDFEFALRNSLLKHANFESVEATPASGDYGADLILATKHGTRIAVQCKRFSSKVNLKAVQEVVAAIKHYGCDLGVVISNNGFLQSAHQLAKSNEIELWDGEAVLKIFAGEFDFSEVFSV